ncbi:hypothetical protein JCM10207_004728 [Rhodosporidiobolus poonsookiae]
MKFNRYLNSHAIDEWRRAYINYRQLKKAIGRAQEELIALDEGGEPPVEPSGRATSAPGGSGGQGASRADGGAKARAEESDLERGRDEEADHEGDTSSEPPSPTRGKSTRPSTPSRLPDLVTSPLSSPGLSELSSSHGHSDQTQGTSKGLVRLASRASSHRSQPGASPQTSRATRNLTRHDSQNGRFPRGPNRRWRPGLSPSMELTEVVEQIPPQCQKFFKRLDKELERVTGFYADREQEAVRRYEDLSAQWAELANHKKEFQAYRAGDFHPPAFVSSFLPKRLPDVPGSNLVRRAVAHRGGHHGRPEARGERRLSDSSVEGGQRNSLERNGSGNGDDNGNARAKGKAATEDEAKRADKVYLHGRPEEYANARSKLKLATFEYYRFLGMLKSYRVLNRTGFAKALKKFEKATGIPCAAQYTKKVEAANFVSSPELDELIRKTEDAFAEVFERGDRKKALERLRDFGQKKRHHFTSWRAGMLMGAGLPLMIEGLVLSFKASTRAEIPYWPALMQFFGACFLPVFFALAFFLNLAAWNYARINYVLIFELDVRTRLDYHQFIELPAVLYFILSLFWWAAWNNFWPDHITPSSYPLAWIVVVIAIMFNPFPVLYPSARWWMLRSFCRMLTSGLVAVEFRDFFLGDEMNSLYYTWYNFGFAACAYGHGWPDDTFSVCSTNRTWTTAILSALPPFIRLGQSIRRYLDSDGLPLHMLNAGKYTATIGYFFAYYSWRIHQQRGNDETWRFALFIVFATVNTLYTSTWDLLMDWSLGHRDVKEKKKFFLRKELAFFKDAPWMYYLAGLVNVVLRFSWVFYLASKPALPVQGYIIALVEAGRRIMWNTLRVEAEHIGNRDGYRVTRDVGLPYVTASSPEATGSLVDDDDDDAGLSSSPGGSSSGPRARVFASLHALHASLVKNFRPLTDSIGGGAGWFALGRRVDPAEREARAVTREAEDEEAQRRRRREYQRRKRRGTLGADESSSESPEGDGEGEDGEGSPGSLSANEAEEHNPGHGRRPSTALSASASVTGSNAEERDAVRGEAEARAGRGAGKGAEEEAEEMNEEEGAAGADEREDDRQLEEGMAEVEAMGKGLGRAGQ